MKSQTDHTHKQLDRVVSSSIPNMPAYHIRAWDSNGDTLGYFIDIVAEYHGVFTPVYCQPVTIPVFAEASDALDYGERYLGENVMPYDAHWATLFELSQGDRGKQGDTAMDEA